MRRLLALVASLSLLLAACGGTSTPSASVSTELWDEGFGPGITSAPIVPFLGGSLIGYGAALLEYEPYPESNEVPLDEAKVIYSDGTPEGTRLLFTGALIGGMGNRVLAVEAAGVGYFIARDPRGRSGSGGPQSERAPNGLYRTDGTAEGTSFVRAAEATAIGAVVRDGVTAVCMNESILRGQRVERGVRCDFFDATKWLETKEMPVERGLGDQLYPVGDRLYLYSYSGPLTYLDPFSESTPVGTLAINDVHSFYSDGTNAELLLVGSTTSTETGNEETLYAIAADGTVRELARESDSSVAPERTYSYTTFQDTAATYINILTATGFVELTEGSTTSTKDTSRVLVLRDAASAPVEISFPSGVKPEPLEFARAGDGTIYAVGLTRLYRVDSTGLVLLSDFAEALIIAFFSAALDGGYVTHQAVIDPASAESDNRTTWHYVAPDGSVSPISGLELTDCGGSVTIARDALYADCADGTGAIYRFDAGEVTRLMLAPEGERWQSVSPRTIGGRAVVIYTRKTADDSAPARYYLAELPVR
jgi:hypothetical protein